MPRLHEPLDLKMICLQNIIKFMESYWLLTNKELIKQIEGPKYPLYYIGPFESLNDQCIEIILKKLYQENLLNKNHLFLCLHNRLRRIDLSFVKKNAFINSSICQLLGNNCFVSFFHEACNQEWLALKK